MAFFYIYIFFNHPLVPKNPINYESYLCIELWTLQIFVIKIGDMVIWLWVTEKGTENGILLYKYHIECITGMIGIG